MTKALVFDCDGTLLDTTPDYVGAVNKALGQAGLAPITAAEGREYLGYGTDHFVKAAMKGADPGLFAAIRQAYFDYYLDHVFVKSAKYPGVDSLLAGAERLGFKVAIASNKPDAAVKRLFALAFPQYRFAGVYGQVRGAAPKPDPALFARILADLRLAPAEVAYFGDTEVDDLFASRAGVSQRFIVTYGFRSPAFLRAHCHPQAFLATPAAIAETISALA